MGSNSLAIQTVLYGNSYEWIHRNVEALVGSAREAQDRGLVGSWSFLAGDCSPTSVLDGETEKTMRGLVEAQGGDFDYQFFSANLGHGGGHNVLAKSSNSDFILFVNPDSIVAPTTIAALIDTMQDNVGAVDARQIPLEHPKEYDADTGETSWCSGACCLTRRDAFNAVDGFDHETFFLYCDDVDYSWRLKLAGYRCVHQPEARIFHDKRLSITSGPVVSEAEVYYSAEAALLLAYKYCRIDIVNEIEKYFSRGQCESDLTALKSFNRRLAAGRLPKQLDADHRVAQFVKGNYAVHRF
ncbi:glycosyltransferase family 2 protein [Skermania sp. ID1734]|uniref:glycosyltransferase n=1 Tax=Skermania sp. ID1734 TaxID=2597516 RepID=UPI00117EC750|nr:glycosyltransferase [Skermania sp. ID1734]TSD93128.1 glycosyltransferase family 2 protein [Skermania sp. ID1734]